MRGYADDGYFGIPGVLKNENTPPTLHCHPRHIEAAIDRLITDAVSPEAFGEQQAQCFIEERWTPREEAKRYLRLLEGELPEAWLYDPKHIRYLHGAGLTEARLKTVRREFLKTLEPRRSSYLTNRSKRTASEKRGIMRPNLSEEGVALNHHVRKRN